MFGVGVTLKVRDAETRLDAGGANNDEVYTFALVHYLAAGGVVRF